MNSDHPFGDPVPGEAVKPTFHNPTAGYEPRGTWVRSGLTGKRIRVDALRQEQQERAMTTAIAERQSQPSLAAIEQVLIKGDLSGLTDAQRLTHYKNVCDSLGLNPLTTPFDYLKLNGKTILYAKRDAAEQLRKIHGVSILEIKTERFEDVYVVTARAQDKTGRMDASTGAVPLGNIRGEALANALMKAETKAKRRVTLSICGLGMLDETEIETIPAAQPAGYVVEAPTATITRAVVVPPTQSGGDSERRPVRAEILVDADLSTGSTSDEGPDHGVDLPSGARRVLRVLPGAYGAKGFVLLNAPVMGDEAEYPIYNDQLKGLAEELCQTGEPVLVDCKQAVSSKKWRIEGLSRIPKNYEPPVPTGETLTDKDIPF